jgi:hypothetical protein
MSLIEHGLRELTLAQLFDKDSDYNGAIGTAVMELLGVFARQGHSGGSASQVLYIFNKLARFEALTPLNSDPAGWMYVDDNLWQSTRQSSAFSRDGGKSYYLLDEPGRPIHVL